MLNIIVTLVKGCIPKAPLSQTFESKTKHNFMLRMNWEILTAKENFHVAPFGKMPPSAFFLVLCPNCLSVAI